ncbi:GHKL domain-containing protein [Aquimarina sp. BL5]|uniref:ATP-binding protein n=1 Tax=Aquimarina sp. BL5 TaxID=1714860 RepID=UPI000E520A6F|nr:ATP-binding protein [Aquimarina sp. BL5]AXT50173.1 GHKL domain-containing protein [Aquimarina sp. BL5]RKM96354.1 GHKL domain-containing protein [Aquimarina sp. BL5]
MEKIKTFLFVLLFVNTNILAQNNSEYCEVLDKELNTILNWDHKITFLKEAFNEADWGCKVNIFIEIGYIYGLEQKNDSALYYYDKAINLAKSVKNDKVESEELLANAYSKKAKRLSEIKENDEAENLLIKARRLFANYPDNSGWNTYYHTYATIATNKAEHEKALKYIDSTVIFSKRINDTVSLPSNYHNKGVYLLRLSRHKESSENLLLALELKEKQKNPSQLAATYFVLGVAYIRWDQPQIGIKYLKKAVARARKESNDYTRLLSYSQIAHAQRKLKDIKNSLKFIDSAQVLAIQLDNKSQLAQAYIEKGWLYLKSYKEYDQAENYFLKAYDQAKLGNNDLTLYPSIRGIIESYLYKGEYKKAKKYFTPYKEVTERIGSLRYTQEYFKRYSEYYEKAGKPDSAMKYLKKYFKIKDSISDTKVKTQVADLEKKYDTKSKELDIVKLTKEKEEQQLVVQKAKAQQNLYLLAASFLLLLLGIGAWAFRKLRKQQKELTSTNQVKNRLFSIIAHDLRGMIIPFQRSGKILKHHIDKGNHEKTIELSQALEQNSESLSNMLDNLLNWSLEQMNGYKMNLENLSIKEELSKIILGYEQQATYKKTKIELEYQNDFNIKFDRGAFHVIFRNLIGNALKYTEEGSIRIKFTSKNDMFLCSVIDTGVGMSKDQLENLFTLEEKKSTVGTQGEKGTGLGLNLVYRFVKMYKGTIQVSSEKRIGTRFDLSMPITISLTKEDGAISKPLSA